MFYSQFILAKKGPLGTIWIAAHLERKLRKNQVADTDIGVSVDSILFPEMPIALRLSSHLLLGVVRIYSRKVNYLFDDCSEALLKVKQAFRSTAVDLPPEESTAPYHSITLPETFDLDDFELPDNDIFQGNYVDHHISSRDQITLQDTMEGVVYSTSKFGLDERFGDGDTSGLDLDEELFVEKAATVGQASGILNSNIDPQASLQATAPKHEENQGSPTVPEVMPASSDVNQIEDFDGDNEPVDYAQAPCTPGLWEEPNLSNIQETSACDDNHEPESHYVTESAVKENLEIASSKETEYFPPEEHTQFEQHEKSLSAIEETEHMLMGDLDLTPFTKSFEAVQVRSTSPEAEALDPIVAPSDDHDKVVLDGNARDMGPEVQSFDNNHDNHAELQGIQENISHMTIGLDSNTEPLGNPEDQALREPKDANISDLSAHYSNPEDQALREPKDANISDLSAHYSMPSYDFPILRPCITQLNPSETNGEGPDATDAVERNWQGIHVSEKNQVAPNITNGLVDNVIQVDNIGSYTSSDFPAPEKLMSVTEGLSNMPKDLLLEATPAEDVTRVDGHHAGSDMLTGKKRSFTGNSLETHSFNLMESSGLFTTNITAPSARDDDDLLSSILVGRKSSFLKVKPTPPEMQSTKRRRRSAPRTGIYKRKVLMDDNMVLHGDTIRLQLMNTEDIRRLRKKAPCTRPEISMIQKQFWEDELFSEAIFTGVSIELASLHSQSHNLSKIKVSHSEASSEGPTELKSVPQSDENGKQLEVVTENMNVFVQPDVPKENGGEPNFDPVASKDAGEAHPIEEPLMTENQPWDNNTMDLDYYGSQAHVLAAGDVAEPFSSEHDLSGPKAGAEIDGKTFSDADIGISIIPIDVDSMTHKTDVVSSDACDMRAAVGQAETHNSLQTDEKIDIFSVDMDPCNIGEIKVDIASVGEISETKNEPLVEEVEDGTSVKTLTDDTDCLENSQIANTKFSSEADGLRPDYVTLDQDMEEIRKNEEEFVNKDATLGPEVVHNAQNLVFGGIFDEELVAVTPYNTELNLSLEDASLDNRENQGHQVTSPGNGQEILDNNRVDTNELNYYAAENDTDFLNFDDDDDDGETEAAGDYMPNSEATHYIDNSGWSSRTKNVAKYLQIMFDKEGERERKVLPLNKLLAGKTRKEASRMFFETLVLKTKDYIHVEQRDPYEMVEILPQAKLLKSDF